MPSKNLVVDASDTEVIEAPASGFLRILGYQITSAGDPGRVTLKAGSTVLVGVSSFSASGGGAVAANAVVGADGYGDAAARTAITCDVETPGVDVDINIQWANVGR